MIRCTHALPVMLWVAAQILLNWTYLVSTYNCHDLWVHPVSPSPPPTVPPSASLPPSIEASQGDSLTLDCETTGNPSPTITWLRDSEPLPSNSRISVSPEGLLSFTSLYFSDEGSYTCIVNNSVGSTSANTLITVLGKTTAYLPQLHYPHK